MTNGLKLKLDARLSDKAKEKGEKLLRRAEKKLYKTDLTPETYELYKAGYVTRKGADFYVNKTEPLKAVNTPPACNTWYVQAWCRLAQSDEYEQTLAEHGELYSADELDFQNCYKSLEPWTYDGQDEADEQAKDLNERKQKLADKNLNKDTLLYESGADL